MRTNKHDENNNFGIKDFGLLCIWGMILCTGIMMLPGLF